jgi:hypothetical protein
VQSYVLNEVDESGRLGAWYAAEGFRLDTRPGLRRLHGEPGGFAGPLLIPEGGHRLLTNMGRRTALARSFAQLAYVRTEEFAPKALEFANRHGQLGLDEMEFVTEEGLSIRGERIKDWERHARRVAALDQLMRDAEDLVETFDQPTSTVSSRLRSWLNPTDSGASVFSFPPEPGTAKGPAFPRGYSDRLATVDDAGIALMVRHAVAGLILRELRGKVSIDLLGCDLRLLDRPAEERPPMALNYLGTTLLATIYHQLAVALVSPKAKRWATCPCGRQFRQSTARQRFHSASCRSKYRAHPTSKESTS